MTVVAAFEFDAERIVIGRDSQVSPPEGLTPGYYAPFEKRFDVGGWTVLYAGWTRQFQDLEWATNLQGAPEDNDGWTARDIGLWVWNVLRERVDDRKDGLEAVKIMAPILCRAGAGVFEVDSFGSVLRIADGRLCTCGSGSMYALGAWYTLAAEGPRWSNPLAEAQARMKRALEAACALHDGCGAPIKVEVLER